MSQPPSQPPPPQQPGQPGPPGQPGWGSQGPYQQGPGYPGAGQQPPGTKLPGSQQPPKRPLSTRAVSLVTAASVIVALGVGVLVGYLVFDSDDGDGGGAVSPAAEVEYACTMVKHVQAEHTDKKWGGLGEDPGIWQIQSAAAVPRAAALEDPKYDDLGDIGEHLTAAMMTLDMEKMDQTMTKFLSECDSL
ncbi:MAG: hypothetical protein ACRDQA_07855 [Nocardioidaceae bacterium]